MSPQFAAKQKPRASREPAPARPPAAQIVTRDVDTKYHVPLLKRASQSPDPRQQPAASGRPPRLPPATASKSAAGITPNWRPAPPIPCDVFLRIWTESQVATHMVRRPIGARQRLDSRADRRLTGRDAVAFSDASPRTPAAAAISAAV
jgi:hypothetical protein